MLSTYYIQTTYINPTVLRINFPTNPRRQQSSFTNVYASGFYISLSYDENNYSDSLTLVIYNDLCYSCSASTMECNMTVRKHHCWPLIFNSELKMFLSTNKICILIRLKFQPMVNKYTLPFYHIRIYCCLIV